MKRWFAPTVLVLFVLALFAFGIWYEKQEQQNSKKVPLVGEIVVYTDISNNITTLLAEAYGEEKSVKVTIMALTEEQMMERIQKNDFPNGDLVITDQDTLVEGSRLGRFVPIITERADEISPQFKDEDGAWVGLWYDPMVFIENENFYKGKGQFITTWQTLEKPGDWRVIIPDFVATRAGANLLYSMVEIYGADQTMERLRKIKTHVTQHTKFLPTPVRLAALGETDIGIGNYSDTAQFQRNSYPIRMIYPADGTAYYVTGVAMLARGASSPLTISFVNWLLAKHTAQLLMHNQFYFIFTNPEVTTPKDSLGRELVLWPVKGGYTSDGKKVLLNRWVSEVRFK